MSKIYLTYEQLCERIHMCVSTARARVSKKKSMPPSFKIGRRRLFPEDELEKWEVAQLQQQQKIQRIESARLNIKQRGRPTKKASRKC